MKCPVCDNDTFNANDYEFEICKECFWQYDTIQVKEPNYAGGANDCSLNEYKKVYKKLKVENPKFSCKYVSDRDLIIKLTMLNPRFQATCFST